ncbi:MAG: 1-acyl-sn-glycerol-3-phosphate acyltransferase [Lachnospiraceae bacterium]|nr:1-acyl-sn-glycerol-3-phosphate acyltransferase [Lachnospiraceae bacterium]
MVRFYYVILTGIPLILFYIAVMSIYAAHPEKYDEYSCYALAQKLIGLVKKRGRISTKVFGTENLPKENGYMMYSNHQGKYDALGIMAAHEQPCSVIMEYERSNMFGVTQFIELIKGKRLKRDDLRQQMRTLNEVAGEVAAGRRYLIFPEGGYDKNHNEVQEFKAGSFKCVQKAKCPIVPVAIWDSYKAFEGKSLKRVVTQVHFLPAISYDEYAGMKTNEISNMVKERIEICMDTIRKEMMVQV